MSLSIELCHQLYKAGFPQEPCERFWIAVDRGTALGNVYDRTHQPVACECPNSDELIEQIQAEWPNCVGFHCFTSCWDWWAAFELEVQRKPQEIVELQEGGTPHLAEALANLYIALKEQV